MLQKEKGLNARFLLIIFITFIFSGCAAGIKMANYRDLDLDNKVCEIRPPEYVINKKNPKVAILPVKDLTEFKGVLSKPAIEALTQILSSGTGLEIVERAQLDNIIEEVKLRDDFGDNIDPSIFTNLVKNIDFVILGSVSSVNIEAKFTEASKYKGQDGKYYTDPPSCIINGVAIVNIRAVSTTTGSIYKVFDPFKGKISLNSENVRSNSACRVKDPIQIARNATIKAIENAKDDFIDAFPHYGYISKTKTNPKNVKDRIAYISLGRQNGLKAGDKLILCRYSKTHDMVTKKDFLTIQDVCEVEVNETGLSDENSWIRIPEQLADDVLPGFIVKTKANRHFLKKFLK